MVHLGVVVHRDEKQPHKKLVKRGKHIANVVPAWRYFYRRPERTMTVGDGDMLAVGKVGDYQPDTR